MPESNAKRATKALNREVFGARLRRTPPYQRTDNSEIADSVEPERSGDAKPCGNHASERRSDCTAYVDADTVRRNCGVKVLFGNELRDDGLPRRSRQRAACPDQKCEQQ